MSQSVKKKKKRKRINLNLIVLAIIGFFLCLIPFSETQESPPINSTYTSSSETHCLDGKCSTTLYSGTVFTKEPDNEWYSLAEVSTVKWENQGFNFSYRNYWVLLEPFVIYNGNEKTIQDIKNAFPNIDIKDYVQAKRFNHKFALNFSNIPENMINNTDYFGLKLKDSYGLIWSDVKKTSNHSIVVKDKVEIDYGDLIRSSFTLNLVNRSYLLIGNISENYHNGSVFLDPTIQLQSATTENFADLEIDNSVGLAGVIIKWNITAVPSGQTIDDSRQCFYLIFNTGLDSDTNISRINDQAWDESISAAAVNALGLTDEDVTKTWSSTTTETWTCVDVTTQIKASYDAGNENASLWIEDPDNPLGSITATWDADGLYWGDGGGDYFYLEDREDGGFTGNPPYLNITYSALAGDTTYPTITQEYPADNYFNDTTQNPTVNFNISATDETELSVIELWANFTGTWEKNQSTWLNGTDNSTIFNITLSNGYYIWGGRVNDSSNNVNWTLSNYTIIINYSAPPDSTPPVISAINCTSNPSGDTTEPYNTTGDLTPSFTFTTDENANATISDTNNTFTTCTTTGGTSHICYIPYNISLNFETDYVYVNVSDANKNAVYDEWQVFTASYPFILDGTFVLNEGAVVVKQCS